MNSIKISSLIFAVLTSSMLLAACGTATAIILNEATKAPATSVKTFASTNLRLAPVDFSADSFKKVNSTPKIGTIIQLQPGWLDISLPSSGFSKKITVRTSFQDNYFLKQNSRYLSTTGDTLRIGQPVEIWYYELVPLSEPPIYTAAAIAILVS
jgi:hypothetical protein